MTARKVFFTRQQIERAIAVTGAEVSRWNPDDAKALVRELGRRYCNGALSWESLVVDKSSQRRNYGKEDVCQYVDGHVCLIVTEEGDVFEAKDSTNLRLVFDETPGFEFYVCDREMTYLLCLNDHDYLIGCGRSLGFVDSLIERH